MDICKFKIENVPNSVYYIQNFITADEENDILKHVYSVPKPKWTFLKNRRLQDYGGVPHEKGMIPEKLPTWLEKYVNKVGEIDIFNAGNRPNHVLINEYLPGQGILPHTDGPLFSPLVTTISCGSHTILEFKENDEKRAKICDFLLERCSLIVITDSMYSEYLHSIQEIETDSNVEKCANFINNNYPEKNVELKRKTRISLTIRHVPKVLKIKLF